MSRIASKPVEIPGGVQVTLDGQQLSVKGSKGTLAMTVHETVEVKQADGTLQFAPRKREATAVTGTMRQLANNMVVGVSSGFEKKLELNGVGYRARIAGQTLTLTVGYSHPVEYEVPKGVTAETPSQTEIVVRGADKQLVGQVAAEIRGFRPPEPYKGKGIRYADEYVRRKETKKK